MTTVSLLSYSSDGSVRTLPRTEPIYIAEAFPAATEPIMFKVTSPADAGQDTNLVAYVPATDPHLPELRKDQHLIIEPVDQVPAAYLLAAGLLS